MLISEKLVEAFNRQIGSELGASNQYLHVAAYFEAEVFPATAAFFYRQSDEEREHADAHRGTEERGDDHLPAANAVRSDAGEGPRAEHD